MLDSLGLLLDLSTVKKRILDGIGLLFDIEMGREIEIMKDPITYEWLPKKRVFFFFFGPGDLNYEFLKRG